MPCWVEIYHMRWYFSEVDYSSFCHVLMYSLKIGLPFRLMCHMRLTIYLMVARTLCKQPLGTFSRRVSCLHWTFCFIITGVVALFLEAGSRLINLFFFAWYGTPVFVLRYWMVYIPSFARNLRHLKYIAVLMYLQDIFLN